MGWREYQRTLTRIKFTQVIPWLSLSWGVISVFLIEHSQFGIHKVLFFAAVFATAGLAGQLIPKNNSKTIDWFRSVSQQASIQYILFFSVPLLWKAKHWEWLFIITTAGISTLWDPLFNTLWRKHWYKWLQVALSCVIVCALMIVLWAPFLFEYSRWILVLIFLSSIVTTAFLSRRKQTSSAVDSSESSNPRHEEISWNLLPLFMLFGLLLMSQNPMPPLGVWVAGGSLVADGEIKLLECNTRISAPSGFRSQIFHRWTILGESRMHDIVRLSEVTGNGIDDKPFSTRSRKTVFPIPWNSLLQSVVRCEVLLPGALSVGKVEEIPKSSEQPLRPDGL